MRKPDQVEIIAAMPASARALVDDIGFVATLKVLKEFGGGRLYVPLNIDRAAGQRLVESLGPQTARALIEARGGMTWEVPMLSASYERLARDRAICADFDAAISAGSGRAEVVHALRARYQVARRTVGRALGKERAAPMLGRPPGKR